MYKTYDKQRSILHYLGTNHSPCPENIFFRYRERSRRRLILEAGFEESRVVALMVFGLICIIIVDFNMYLY